MKVIVTEIKHSDFVEEEHPRDKDGKFTVKNDSDDSTTNETTKNDYKQIGSGIKDFLKNVRSNGLYETMSDVYEKTNYWEKENKISDCFKSEIYNPKSKRYESNKYSDADFINALDEYFKTVDDVAETIEPGIVNNMRDLDSNTRNDFIWRMILLRDVPDDQEYYSETLSIAEFEEYARRDNDPIFYDGVISKLKAIGMTEYETMVERLHTLYIDRVINGENSEWQKILKENSLKHSDFVEEEHPRDKDGKFTTKGNEQSNIESEEVKKKISEADKPHVTNIKNHGYVIPDEVFIDKFNTDEKFQESFLQDQIYSYDAFKDLTKEEAIKQARGWLNDDYWINYDYCTFYREHANDEEYNKKYDSIKEFLSKDEKDISDFLERNKDNLTEDDLMELNNFIFSIGYNGAYTDAEWTKYNNLSDLIDKYIDSKDPKYKKNKDLQKENNTPAKAATARSLGKVAGYTLGAFAGFLIGSAIFDLFK